MWQSNLHYRPPVLKHHMSSRITTAFPKCGCTTQAGLDCTALMYNCTWKSNRCIQRSMLPLFNPYFTVIRHSSIKQQSQHVASIFHVTCCNLKSVFASSFKEQEWCSVCVNIKKHSVQAANTEAERWRNPLWRECLIATQISLLMESLPDTQIIHNDLSMPVFVIHRTASFLRLHDRAISLVECHIRVTPLISWTMFQIH